MYPAIFCFSLHMAQFPRQAAVSYIWSGPSTLARATGFQAHMRQMPSMTLPSIAFIRSIEPCAWYLESSSRVFHRPLFLMSSKAPMHRPAHCAADLRIAWLVQPSESASCVLGLYKPAWREMICTRGIEPSASVLRIWRRSCHFSYLSEECGRFPTPPILVRSHATELAVNLGLKNGP